MLGEFSITLVFMVLLAFLVNPQEHLWMPNMSEQVLVAILVLLFAAYAIFFWREKSHDEREDLHRMFAGRVAFLAGAGMLVISIALQAHTGMIDPALPLSLGAMIFAKSAARAWGSRRK